MKKILIMLAIMTVGCIYTTQAQKAAIVTSDKTGWHKIAETTVSFQNEKDEVIVMGADRFATIKFIVTDAPIHLKKMEVHFESGDKQVITVNASIKKEGESATFGLTGGERTLKKIVFFYNTVPNAKDEKAHVEIWGMKTNRNK